MRGVARSLFDAVRSGDEALVAQHLEGVNNDPHIVVNARHPQHGGGLIRAASSCAQQSHALSILSHFVDFIEHELDDGAVERAVNAEALNGVPSATLGCRRWPR